MATDTPLNITLVYSAKAREVLELALTVPPGCTVLQAVQVSGLLQHYPSIDLASAHFGVWGRRCVPSQTLREHDRVEVYRDLTVDPKVARRERFAKQGAKTAGLFVKKREGAKAGY
jgi:putative ubiquitin-RnfH superfamily antitoxin RatB of RatAB toxin-antitoxin module